MEPPAVELASTVASVDAAEEWADLVGIACGLGDDARYRLALAVREAAANAVLHGNRRDPARRVRLSWVRTDGRLLVTIGDEGAGFIPPPPPAADGPVSLAPSGRGLVMIRHLADTLTVTRRDHPPGTDVVLGLDLTE